jgi:hypothetical protein
MDAQADNDEVVKGKSEPCRLKQTSTKDLHPRKLKHFASSATSPQHS